MTSPSVTLTEIDGALGIQPPDGGNMLALVGDSSSGTVNTPVAFGRIADVQSYFGAGKLVEAAAYAIEHFGKPVLCVRTTASTAASSGTVTATFAGTSVPTVDAASASNDDYEVKWLCVTGGTRGTAGITFKYSLDGGRTYSAETALGTAVTYTIPGSGGIVLDFAAGTIIAGDYFTFRAVGPAPDATAVGLAFAALALSEQPWELAECLFDGTGALLDVVEAKFAAMHAQGKHKWYSMNFRVPALAESDATYQTAFSTSFATHSTTYGEVTAGSAYILSSISYRLYTRPIGFATAPLYASVSEEQDISRKIYGPLDGVQINDTNGNPVHHNEFESPGLDALRATTLRTWANDQGVYVNNPRILYPAGSDFQLVQYRRVMNLARTAVRSYLEGRLSQDIRVNRLTGFILESEARDIEAGATNALETALLTKPKASAVTFVLSRTDNVLSTQTLHYEIRVVPLGYAKSIIGTIAFNNPSIRVTRA